MTMIPMSVRFPCLTVVTTYHGDTVVNEFMNSPGDLKLFCFCVIMHYSANISSNAIPTKHAEEYTTLQYMPLHGAGVLSNTRGTIDIRRKGFQLAAFLFFHRCYKKTQQHGL